MSTFGLYHWTGLKTNGTQILIIPLLAMGLGVNDMFVLLIGLSSFGAARIVTEDYPEILGEVLGHAGEGVSLTTVCNFACFMNGLLIPVVAIQHMCLHASIVAMANLSVVLTVFVARLKEESRRIKAGQVDISLWSCVCLCHASQPANPDVSSWGSSSQNFISTTLGPCIVQPPVWAGIILLTFLLIVLAVLSMPQMGNGWIIYHFVDQGTNEFRAFHAISHAFSIWENYFGCHSIDVPYVQQQQVDFFWGMMSDKYTYPNLAPIKYEMFALQLLIGGGPALLSGCLDNTFAFKDGCVPKFWTSPLLNLIAEGMGVGLTSWIFGLADPDNFYALYGTWTYVPEDPWEPILTPRTVLQDYNNADLCKSFEDAFDAHKHSFYWVDIYYVLDVMDNFLIEDNIIHHREVFNDNPLSARVTIGFNILVWFWEVFGYTGDLFRTSLWSVSVCVFGLTWALLRSFKAACVGTVMDVIIVAELWGLIANWTEFNVFAYAFLMLAFGVSVEFTAHTIAYFEIARGDAVQRLRIAMRATVPPVVLGGWSTCLAMLPLWFAKQISAYVYCSAILTCLQFLGFFNGILVLPSFLSCLAFILGVCGMGMQRVSSKRNSKGSQPAAAPANPEQPAAAGTKAALDGADYAVDLDDAPVSPVRKFEARGHFNQV
jgi:hypothetical protein